MSDRRILVLTKYPRLGASSRLRSLQYLPLLEKHGFSFTVQSLTDERYLTKLYQNNLKRPRTDLTRLYLRRLRSLPSVVRYDLIWVEKEVFPFLPAYVERLLGALQKPYVVDYDDATFHTYDRARNPLIRRLLGKKIDNVMRLSSCVIAGNEYLASRATVAGARKIEIVPTVLDERRYELRNHRATDNPTIGWIGSPSSEKCILLIKDALHRVCLAHNARLLLVGASPNITTHFPRVRVDAVPWEEASEAQFVRQMDIGIMPLADADWERGKCGYKLIQYMACGVPVVASPVGANREIVTDSNAGLLAATHDEWVRTLTELLSSHQLRQLLGHSGRAAVDRKYSVTVQAPAIAKILSEAITSRR